MRFLLISDTHGKLGVINELVARTQADVVIHAGDFGFYDDGSYERLSDRELRLQVAHGKLLQSEKNRILALSHGEQVEAVKQGCLLGEFQAYLDGEESFRVPVYAVWGNHEDKDVVERLFRGDVAVENLHILHHGQAYHVGPALVYGLGGNLLPGSKMMQKPIAGGGGKVWSTLSQYADLVRVSDAEADWTGLRIFVSHVSPGKEPFVELVGARTRADFTISGHMGVPTCMIWNPFAIHSVEEAGRRLERGLEAVRTACLDTSAPSARWADQMFSFIGRLPEETMEFGRGGRAPRWYRCMSHVNLPDAHIGYALMDVNEGGVNLQTFAS
jgi:predicted phosphodiesterase